MKINIVANLTTKEMFELLKNNRNIYDLSDICEHNKCSKLLPNRCKGNCQKKSPSKFFLLKDARPKNLSEGSFYLSALCKNCDKDYNSSWDWVEISKTELNLIKLLYI